MLIFFFFFSFLSVLLLLVLIIIQFYFALLCFSRYMYIMKVPDHNNFNIKGNNI